MSTTLTKASEGTVRRTPEWLREILFVELEDLRAGRGNLTQATAIAKLATGIADTIQMEMKVHRFVEQMANPEDREMIVIPTVKNQ